MIKVGDVVVTDYRRDESGVKRKITGIMKSPVAESGFLASADGGEPCPHCGRTFAQPITMVDSAWFKVEGEG
jgi:hypothetical protein